MRALYRLRSTVWLYPGEAAWHFISLPKKEARDIKRRFGLTAQSWGSIPVLATIGNTTWKTSIFPDKKSDTYLLPVKAQVRKKEDIYDGDVVNLTLALQ